MTSGIPQPSAAVVVGGNPVQVNVLAGLLRTEGVATATFGSVEAALAGLVPAHPPDLIVTDLCLPDVDGWRFCRLLRSSECRAFRTVPVVIVSATLEGDCPERTAADLGIAAFLSSPVDKLRFVSLARSLLQGGAERPLDRVLIVEEDRTLADSLASSLVAHGYRADSAVTVREAEERLGNSSYEVAVLDHRLPDGSGDALLDTLRIRHPECVSLMIADAPTPELALQWMMRGASACLHKPFAPETLAEECARARRERAFLRAEERFETNTRRIADERRRLESILDATRAGTWEWDVPTGETIFNERWAEIVGYTLAELAPVSFATWEGLMHPDDLKLANQCLARHFAGETPYFSCECRMRHKDGSWIWIRDHGKVTSWSADGKPLWVSGTHIDITERKRNEEALEKRMLFLTSPLDQPEGVAFEDLFDIADIQRLQDQFAAATGVASIITRADGTPITRPSRFCRLCQHIIRGTEKGRANCYRSDAVLGRWKPDGPTIQPCLSGGLWDAGAAISVGGRHIANWLIGQVRDETQTDEAMRAYAREIGADEEATIAAFHEVPAMSRERFGEISQALFTFANQLSTFAYQNVQQARFISERRRAEEERAKLQEQLAQAQKMEAVGRLAGGVAHDFNNMLAVILGHAEMALERIDPGHPFFVDLTTIRDAAEHSADLTRQLLAFARKQTVSPKVLDLNLVVGDMMKMLHRLIGEHIALVWRPGHGLGQVRIDPGQIDQILANLCVNARDAIDGVGTVTIETDSAVLDDASCAGRPDFSPGEYVTLAVSDDGCGMDAETVASIFEPFFTTKGQGKGTGLGLATVYGAVRQNNSLIDVQSEPGQGTTFRIYFPRHREEIPQPSGAGQDEPSGCGNETILLVEDEPTILRMAATMLQREGYTVLPADNVGEAIRLAEAHLGRIDLLVSDVVMPQMNGRELARSILSLNPDLKCLFMSGYTADAIAHHGVLDEGVNFINKPFRRSALLRAVRVALESQSAPSP